MRDWRSQVLQKPATKRLPKVLDIDFVTRSLPPNCFIFESSTEGRIRVFMKMAGRPSFSAAVHLYGHAAALRLCMQWAWRYWADAGNPCPWQGLLED